MDQPVVAPGSWAGATQYEAYVGRWSRPVARRFLAWLAVPGRLRWLDVGCGTGALTEAVLAACAPESVLGVDPSAAFLGHATAHVRDPRASFREGDARALPVADRSVDAVVSALVLNFVPEPAAALAEMARAARPGGVVGAYVWDYAEGMQLIRLFWDAAAAVDPAARALDEAVRFPGCAPDPLHTLFTGAGLADVSVREIVVPTVFCDLDDYWTPFLGGTGPAPAYVASLAEADRTALRAEVGRRLPVGADGVVRLSARAWAVRGRRR
ncbi:class I SAM-dependent methyltransferase [Geodermatophilus sp. SYSU D00965]